MNSYTDRNNLDQAQLMRSLRVAIGKLHASIEADKYKAYLEYRAAEESIFQQWRELQAEMERGDGKSTTSNSTGKRA